MKGARARLASFLPIYSQGVARLGDRVRVVNLNWGVADLKISLPSQSSPISFL